MPLHSGLISSPLHQPPALGMPVQPAAGSRSPPVELQATWKPRAASCPWLQQEPAGMLLAWGELCRHSPRVSLHTSCRGGTGSTQHLMLQEDEKAQRAQQKCSMGCSPTASCHHLVLKPHQEEQLSISGPEAGCSMGTSLQLFDISGISCVWETDAFWLHKGIWTSKRSGASKAPTPRSARRLEVMTGDEARSSPCHSPLDAVTPFQSTDPQPESTYACRGPTLEVRLWEEA